MSEMKALPAWPVRPRPIASDAQTIGYERACYIAALARLRVAVEALAEAIEDIDSWAGYASGYFQDKHDLIGTLARHRHTLAAIGDIP